MTGIRRPEDDGPHPGDPEVDLDDWLAELRADAVGQERSRRRMLVQAAAEEATVHGAITDLAERGEPVVIELSGDRMVRGVVRLVGADVVVLRDGRNEAIVRLEAVAAIRLRPDQPGPAGAVGRAGPAGRAGPVTTRVPSPHALAARPVSDVGDLTFVRVLAALVEDTPTVTLHRKGVRTPLTGTLAGVGDDIAVVHTPGAVTTYVPLWSVLELSLTGSG